MRTLALDGELTVGRGDLELRAAVQDLLESGHPKIVLDLSGVRYIDSSGLGEMIACRTRTRSQGGDLKLVAPGKKVYEVLLMSRATEVFGIFDDETEAVASF